MRKEMSNSRARTDADLAEGEEREKSSVLVSHSVHQQLLPLLCLNLHPSPLMCLGNSLSLERKRRKRDREAQDKLRNFLSRWAGNFQSFQLSKHSHNRFGCSTHLMNLRAKDLSFPVAAAAASSRSRLFPDNMCPRTPRRPSGDLEWSASTV